MTRTHLIQSLIKKFNYKSYLEIGCANNANFNHIHTLTKIGVDPGEGGTHRMSSDTFFATNEVMFDIIFIDGLHRSHQVDRDIENSLKFLNPSGTIVMHDCNPVLEEHQTQEVLVPTWNGDVWKSFVKQRCLSNIDAATGDFDYGCGVLRVRPNSQQITVDAPSLNWNNLVEKRQEWLRLMSFNNLMAWV